MANASAQALWQDVPAGATRAEVQALMPEAKAATPGAQPDGSDATLEIASYELASERFKVTFVFTSDQLQRITLLSDAGSADKARALAQRLTTLLRSRYGLEQSTKSRGSVSSVTIDRQWTYRRTRVHLQVENGTNVRLDYTVLTPASSNRL
jgi:hypothetical protein